MLGSIRSWLTEWPNGFATYTQRPVGSTVTSSGSVPLPWVAATVGGVSGVSAPFDADTEYCESESPPPSLVT